MRYTNSLCWYWDAGCWHSTDDMVLLSESIEGLQKMLNTLSNYTKEWDLNVNLQKTKIIIFRNGSTVRDNEKCFLTTSFWTLQMNLII